MHSKPIQFHRTTFVKDLVFIDGLGRSGKFLLAPIVASLERVEQFRMSWLLEYIPIYLAVGQMSFNVALDIFKTEIELLFYENAIGRKINAREADLTSFCSFRDPEIYRKRIRSAEEGDLAVKTFLATDPIMAFLTHDIMCHSQIPFEAFPSLKIIHIKRHPITMIDSWCRRRTESQLTNVRLSTPTILGEHKILPWDTYNWIEEAENLSYTDLLIKISSQKLEQVKKSFETSSQEKRKQIMLVYFEELVTKPHKVVKEICEFLETTDTDYTQLLLKKEGCPRQLARKDKYAALERIEKAASTEATDSLLALSDEYENEFQCNLDSPLPY
jgi:hypothetical protein